MQIKLAAADTNALESLGTAGRAAGFTNTPSITDLVANGILLALSLSGIILVCLLVYGGFLYLSAAGNPENVKKAKQLMANAVIGIIIIVAAYAIASFVISALVTAVSPGAPTP